MTCASCALTVTKGMEKAGLHDVNANFASGEVSFMNPDNLSMELISKEISSIGYTVVDENKSEPRIALIEWKFIFAAVLTVPLFLHMFLPKDAFLNDPTVQLILCSPVYLLALWHFGKSSLSIFRTGVAHMDVLILIGVNAAFWYSVWGAFFRTTDGHAHDYLFFETASMITTLVLLGNVIEHRSVSQTSSAIRDLVKLQKVIAKVIVRTESGTRIEERAADALQLNDLVQVNMGDQVPGDGIVESGSCKVDESMMTGESVAVNKDLNDELIGGTILRSGSVQLRISRVGKDTVLSQIIELVKQAQLDKPPIQKLADKVTAVFVPVILVASVITFVIGWLAASLPFEQALMNSIAVLVIACPCAMGLATPTAIVAGIGRAAKNGILIRGGESLQKLASVKTMIFDKTGTITTGEFEVSTVEYHGTPEEKDKTLSIAFELERHSSHPIAEAIVEYLGSAAEVKLDDIRELPGEGLTGRLDGINYRIGRGELKDSVVLSREGVPLLTMTITDTIKPGTRELIQNLKAAGIRPVMLSGDAEDRTMKVAELVGIDDYKGDQKPLDKLNAITAFNEESPTAMIGDGINDAPALAKAEIGISMSDSSRIAIQSAQVILLSAGSLNKVYDALNISKHTVLTIKQNLFWALFYNVVAIPIAAIGLLNPMIAALAMALSDVVVIGNSIRLKSKRLR